MHKNKYVQFSVLAEQHTANITQLRMTINYSYYIDFE